MTCPLDRNPDQPFSEITPNTAKCCTPVISIVTKEVTQQSAASADAIPGNLLSLSGGTTNNAFATFINNSSPNLRATYYFYLSTKDFIGSGSATISRLRLINILDALTYPVTLTWKIYRLEAGATLGNIVTYGNSSVVVDSAPYLVTNTDIILDLPAIAPHTLESDRHYFVGISVDKALRLKGYGDYNIADIPTLNNYIFGNAQPLGTTITPQEQAVGFISIPYFTFYNI